MALVKFGAGVSEMRGKEGGVIYSRNAYGAYIKQKVSPVNPQSNSQQTQRGLMGNLAQAWATLDAAEKAAWDNLGAQVTRINRFGDSTTYTGFGLYMRLNRNLSVIGQAAITVAPTIPTITNIALGTFTATIAGGVLTLAFTPTPLAANEWLVVYLTNNILTGRRFVKNFYRFVFKDDAAASPASMWTAWTGVFSNLMVEGATIFAKAKVIDEDTGFDTVPLVKSAIVTAA